MSEPEAAATATEPSQQDSSSPRATAEDDRDVPKRVAVDVENGAEEPEPPLAPPCYVTWQESQSCFRRSYAVYHVPLWDGASSIKAAEAEAASRGVTLSSGCPRTAA